MRLFKNVQKVSLLVSSIATLAMSPACGKKSSTSNLDIVGGRQVTANDSGPEKVSTVGLSGCTGTIIAKDLILTAAHCYDNSVKGGYVLFGFNFNGGDRKIINIEKSTVNSSYTGPHNDVALLKLKSEIPSGYKPVRLLPRSLALNPGDTVRQAGYGVDNTPNSFGILRTVDSRYIGQTSTGGLSVRNGRTAACSGDSGGPLYVQKNGEWFTSGITSTAFMSSPGVCTGGNEYASVIMNTELILQMARQLTGRQDPLAGPVAPEAPAPQAPAPDDLDGGNGSEQNPSGPAKFQVLTQLLQSNQDLSIRIKNISGRQVKSCVFTLTPVRSFWGFYKVSYDLESVLATANSDQEIELKFLDPYWNSTYLTEIQSYTMKKICKQ